MNNTNLGNIEFTCSNCKSTNIDRHYRPGIDLQILPDGTGKCDVILKCRNCGKESVSKINFEYNVTSFTVAEN